MVSVHSSPPKLNLRHLTNEFADVILRIDTKPAAGAAAKRGLRGSSKGSGAEGGQHRQDRGLQEYDAEGNEVVDADQQTGGQWWDFRNQRWAAIPDDDPSAAAGVYMGEQGIQGDGPVPGMAQQPGMASQQQQQAGGNR